jgi:DNA invertase Pin-like site-specific DNA recombinase
MSKRKLALVVRVSDVRGRDRKGDRFISPDEQVRDATAYVGDEYDLVRFDDLNVSHKTAIDARPGMGEALKQIESGKLAGLVVSSQDRIGPLMLTRELKARLLAAGGVLKIADNPAAEVLDATGYAKLPSEYMSLMHEAQREEIGLRWQKARRNAVERGVHICEKAPVGYQKSEDGRLVVDPVTAPAIVKLFKLRADGGSWGECQALLLEHGIDHGHSLSATRNIVANRVYTGEARHGANIRNPNAHDAIVERAFWRAAQSRPQAPRVRTSEGALLGGLVFCASCGRKMTPGSGRYRCRPKLIKADGKPCEAPANANAEAIESYVLRAFFDMLAYRPIAPTSTNLEPYELAVTNARAAVEKWREAADADDVDPVEFGRVIAAQKAKLAVAEQALFEARETAGLNDERLTLSERWGSMTIAGRRRALQNFGVEAHVLRGREPIDERTTIVMRGSPIGDGWEPDDERHVIYSWDEETVAAWNAHFANHPNLDKIVIEPLKLSEEDKAAEEAIFVPLERALRKREREAKRKPKAAA